jgi:hypothetical protein
VRLSWKIIGLGEEELHKERESGTNIQTPSNLLVTLQAIR